MPQASRTFRVFVSSTFEDLKGERNALQRHVFPRLQELCESRGTRFQAIDLRWGVSTEAGLDQQTVRICLEEVARCQRLSPKPNFVVLLGDRYGWRPPPAEIPADEFRTIEGAVTDPGELALLRRWYLRDDNARYRRDEHAPPQALYVLQPRRVDLTGAETKDARKAALDREAKEWRGTEARLRGILLSAASGLPPERWATYETSATEQEIVGGALKPPEDVPDVRQHVFAFFRTIVTEQGVPLADDPPLDGTARNFVDQIEDDGHYVPDADARGRLEELKERKLRPLLGDHVFDPYRATWTGKGVTDGHIGDLPEDLEACERLLQDPPAPPSTLCVDVWCALAPVIVAEIKALGSKTSVQVEVEAHGAFGRNRARHFTGRVEILERIRNYIDAGDGHPLAVVGASGSGKSALMARAAAEAAERHPDAKVVVRFIGATPPSSDGRSLLDTLCRDITQRFGADESTIPTGYRELVREFPERLRLAEKAGERLVVFLDALEQLSPAEGARGLVWLPAELPPNVRVVVSTTRSWSDDGRDQAPGPDPEDCLRALEAKLPEDSLVLLEAMTRKEGEELLEKWLAEAGRDLQPHQRGELLDKFEPKGEPLYLKLAFEEARRWRFHADLGEAAEPERTELAGDIPGVIWENLFGRLSEEENHGPLLVSRSLAYLAAAKNGLSEDEMLDVLSRDQEVLDDFRDRAYHQPPEHRLPVVVWSRLFLDLEPYLTERTADGSSLRTFYHRQLRWAVEAEYLADGLRQERHRALAEYFGYERPDEHGVTASPLTLRKMSELPYQQAMGKLWDPLQETLTDFHFLERKAAEAGVVETVDARGNQVRNHTGIFLVREDFALALELMDGGDGGAAPSGQRPLILTAVDDGDGPGVRCPACQTVMRVDQADLDRPMACRNERCRRALKINPFVVTRRRPPSSGGPG